MFSVRTLLFTLAIDAGICLVAVTVFSILRWYSYTSRFYSPRSFAKEGHLPKPIPPGIFSWILTVCRYTQHEIVETSGLDSAVYLKMLTMGMQLFAVLSVLSLVVVLTTNLTGDEVERLMEQQGAEGPVPEVPGFGPPDPSDVRRHSHDYRFTSFDKTSMANIPPGSPKLWVHLVMTYIVTAVVLKVLWRHTQQVVEARVQYLSRHVAKHEAETCTVLVTDVPGVFYGTLPHALSTALNTTVLRYLPRGLQQRLQAAIQRAYERITSLPLPLPMSAHHHHHHPYHSSRTAAVMGEPASPGLGAGSPGSREPFIPAELQPIPDRTDKTDGAGRQEPNVEDLVWAEFSRVYGEGEVASVAALHDERYLAGLVAQYQRCKSDLEDLTDEYLRKLARGKHPKPRKVRVIGPLYGSWGTERYGRTPVSVPALDFYSEWLQELLRRIQEEQEAAEATEVPTAFVTFRSHWMAAVASTSLHSSNEAAWRLQPAPGPGEAIWQNLPMRLWERELRSNLMWAAFVLLALFYLVPIAAVQALLQIDRLSGNRVIGPIVNLPGVRSLLIGFLPTLALRLFVVLLPPLLALMQRFAGAKSISEQDLGVVTQFFWFQVILVFLASFVAGTLANQAQQWLRHPGDLPRVLGGGAPQTAGFFLLYLLFSGLVSQPVKLLRLPSLVIFWLRYSTAPTERARRRLWQQQQQTLGSVVADSSIALLLGLVFTVVHPLVPVAALLYFVVSLLGERYQQLYVLRRQYESAGRLWRVLFQHVMTALYIFQVVMIGLLGIKTFRYAPLLVPLLLATIIYHTTANRLFHRPLEVLSLHDAAEIDRGLAAQQPGRAAAPLPAAPSCDQLLPGGDQQQRPGSTVESPPSMPKGAARIQQQMLDVAPPDWVMPSQAGSALVQAPGLVQGTADVPGPSQEAGGGAEEAAAAAQGVREGGRAFVSPGFQVSQQDAVTLLEEAQRVMELMRGATTATQPARRKSAVRSLWPQAPTESVV